MVDLAPDLDAIEALLDQAAPAKTEEKKPSVSAPPSSESKSEAKRSTDDRKRLL
jgi:hypothetical protein